MRNTKFYIAMADVSVAYQKIFFKEKKMYAPFKNQIRVEFFLTSICFSDHMNEHF